MKKGKLLICLGTVLAVSALTTGCGREIEVKNGSKVAVSLENDKFTATEYYEKIKENNISVLVDMIDHSLLDEKYKADDKEKESIDNQVNQIKSYYGQDEDSYTSVLRQYFGVETEEELREKLSLEYKRNLAVKDYVKEHLGKEEIKKYYNDNIYGEVKASHILIAIEKEGEETDEDADKRAKEQAESIIKELEDGKKFDSLAKKHSADKTTSANGGDLGFIDVNDVPENFGNALKSLKVGEYTKEPIKTELGYHIILKVEEKEKPKLKEVQDDIKTTLSEQKLKEDSSLYYEALKGLRKDNKIEWNDDVLKKAYNDYMNNLMKTAKK